MANKIVLKKSSVPSKIPQSQDLDFGELALNYTDGKLYFKTASNTIDFFKTFAEVNSFSEISVPNQQSLVASGQESALSIVAGDGINITTNPNSTSLTISSQANTGSASVEVDSRTGSLVTFLSPLMQLFFEYDGVTFRNNTAVVQTRAGYINLLV